MSVGRGFKGFILLNAGRKNDFLKPQKLRINGRGKLLSLSMGWVLSVKIQITLMYILYPATRDMV